MSRRVAGRSKGGMPTRNKAYVNIKYAYERQQQKIQQQTADDLAEKERAEKLEAKRKREQRAKKHPYLTKTRQFFQKSFNRGARGK